MRKNPVFGIFSAGDKNRIFAGKSFSCHIFQRRSDIVLAITASATREHFRHLFVYDVIQIKYGTHRIIYFSYSKTKSSYYIG